MADTPIGYTTHFNIAKFAEGDYPGADALNNNWELIDTALNNAGTAGNFMTVDTAQTITGGKTWNANFLVNGTFSFGAGGTFYPPMDPVVFGVGALKVVADPEDVTKYVLQFGADYVDPDITIETVATREWISEGRIHDLFLTGFRYPEPDSPGIWINFQDEDQFARIKVSDFAEVSPALKPLQIQSSNFAVNYDSELGLTDFNFNGFMVIDDAGNVGIGTTDPSEKLHVNNGNIRVNDSYKFLAGTTGELEVYHDSTNGVIKENEGSLYIGTDNAYDIYFRTNGTLRWEIDGGGGALRPYSPDAIDLGGTSNRIRWVFNQYQRIYERLEADSTLGAYLEGFLINHLPEDSINFDARLVNDLSYLIQRGYAFSNNYGWSDSYCQTLFEPTAGFVSIGATSVPAGGLVFEFDTPTSQYGGYCGVAFGNDGWRFNAVKIEKYKATTSSWETLLDVTDNDKAIVWVSNSNDGAGSTKLRFTFDDPNTSSARIANIFSFDYNSALGTELYVSRGGSSLYDNCGLKFGNGDDLNIIHDGSNSHIRNTTGTLYAGTTGSSSLVFMTNDTSRWTVESDGRLIPNSDSAYDIGWSGSRVKIGYFDNADFSEKIYSPNYASGWSGSGWNIDQGITTSGASSIEADDLTIRGTLRAYELLISKIRAVEGGQIISSASGKVESISGSVYTMEDPDGDNMSSFAVNDIVMIQQVKTDGQTLTKRVVRKVTAVSGNDVTLGSLTGAPADTGSIEVGDAVVAIGNTTDTSRQGSIYMTANDSGSPFIRVMDGVSNWSDWTSQSKIKAQLGNLDGYTFNGTPLSGYGLVSENVYLDGEFILDSNSTITTMQGEIQDIDDQVTINTAGISANADGISLNAGEITTVKGRVTTAEASIIVNADGISSNVSSISTLDGRVDTAESNITQNANNINLKVSKNDVINQINISTEGILIAGDNIEINGSTTFSAGYDPSTKITGAQVDENITTIDGGMIQTNTVTANAINVSQLSAISADLGTITAGTITGVTMQTASSGSRVVIQNGASDISIYGNTTSDRWIIDGEDQGGEPTFQISFNDGAVTHYFFNASSEASGDTVQITTEDLSIYMNDSQSIIEITGDMRLQNNVRINGNLNFDGGTNVDEIQTSVDTDSSALVTSAGIKTYVDNAVADVPTKYILYSDVSLASTAVNAGVTVQEYYQTSSTQQLKIYIPYVHDSKTQTIRVTSQLRVVTGGNTIYMRAKAGAGTEYSASASATSPTTVSVDIDVSGLSDGTLTAIYIYMDSASTGHAGYMKNVVVQAIA